MQFTKDNILNSLMYPGFFFYPTQLEEVDVIRDGEIFHYKITGKKISINGDNIFMKTHFADQTIEIDAYRFAEELSKLPVKCVKNETFDLMADLRKQMKRKDIKPTWGVRVNFYI